MKVLIMQFYPFPVFIVVCFATAFHTELSLYSDHTTVWTTAVQLPTGQWGESFSLSSSDRLWGPRSFLYNGHHGIILKWMAKK